MFVVNDYAIPKSVCDARDYYVWRFLFLALISDIKEIALVRNILLCKT